jgi:hypothetical protein
VAGGVLAADAWHAGCSIQPSMHWSMQLLVQRSALLFRNTYQGCTRNASISVAHMCTGIAVFMHFGVLQSVGVLAQAEVPHWLFRLDLDATKG